MNALADSLFRLASIDERVATYDWVCIGDALDASGCATLPRLLLQRECETLIAGYDAEDRYRSRVVMARHGFGRGEYRYFSHPLPALVLQLRESVYPHLAPIANRWSQALQGGTAFPAAHAEYLERCHAAGQQRPTPLILRYGPGDYNCLHQDLYGAEWFPLQLAVLLSQPERDFGGGEFVLTEQRPRMQSRVEVVALRQGDAVIFAVNQRPVRGPRGVYRVTMRHGVSRVRSGSRHALGVIFHDAA